MNKNISQEQIDELFRDESFKTGDVVHVIQEDGTVEDMPRTVLGTQIDFNLDLVYEISTANKMITTYRHGNQLVSEELYNRVFKGTLPDEQTSFIDNPLYCSCGDQQIVISSTAVVGRIDESNTFKYCRNCKKEVR